MGKKMFNPLDLKDRRYLITGAASGIGKACAIYLSKLGADLLLVDINKEQLEFTNSSENLKASILEIDLTNVDALKEKITNEVEDNRKLNGFVHCAGVPYIAPLKTISSERVKKVLDINTIAGLELAKLFINRKIYAGDHGSIVFISSVYGLVGSVANVGYALSKGAVHSITKALAIELAPKNIRVNCIAPGFIKTEMSDLINHNFDSNHDKHIESLHPLGLGKTDDIAAGVAFLFSDMSRWVTGSIISIDGGFTAQ